MRRIKEILKRIIPSNTHIYKLLSKIYNFREPQYRSLEEFLSEFANTNISTEFVQIGSNDGRTSDPLFLFIIKHGWKGILVEPDPLIFNQLLKNYNTVKSNLIFENIAIGPKKGIQTFYSISDTFKSNVYWAQQLGSLNKDVILKHSKKFNDITEHIKEIQVQVLTINELLVKHKNNIRDIDLLHIDAEGYDYDILIDLDFDYVKPSIIIYEYIHLTINQKRILNKKLRHNNYKLYWDAKDIFGVIQNE